MSEEMDAKSLQVRDAGPADELGVKELITAAFGQDTEAGLVHRLRHCGALVLELVAVTDRGRLMGHISFSRVTPADAGPGRELTICCLAPVSVWPEFQRQGIGSLLIETAIAKLKDMGEDLILVLGPPSYYPRFGFDPELAKKVRAPYAGNAFQALALTDAGKNDLPVEVAFATPFEEFE
ncbi:GNAT family N-acetyltransferase [Roseibium sp.]|uniref:GNAT family N-acetyltransferase n=1 Tax=Roseibium sp. TaxID=1936156 RepID=UPI003A97F0EE